MDNDGDQDMLVVGYEKGELAFSKNEGNGFFSTPDIIMEGSFFLNAVYLGDLNNDSWLDIAVVGEFGISLGYILNNGTGGFDGFQPIITTMTEAEDVQTADIDGDGWLDLVVATSMDNKVYWFQNLGGAGFADQQLVAENMNATKGIDTGDIDNDGDIDIFVQSGPTISSRPNWFRNDGQGGFTLESFPPSGLEVYRITGWKLGDMDQDGDLDLVSATSNNNNLRWHRNNGNGDFSSSMVINTTISLPAGLDLADLDNDGDLEIIVAASGSGSAQIVVNNGDGTFADPITIATGLNDISTMHAAELNGDGMVDVISVSAEDDEIVVYLNEGELDFSMLFVQNPQFAGLQIVKAVELTGDNLLEVVVFADDETNLGYLSFQTDGSFSELIPIGDSGDYSSLNGFTIADVDGNSYQDIIGMDANTGHIFWYPNEGGQFAPREIIAPAFNVFSLQNNPLLAEDIDGDGDADLFGFSIANGEIRYYENLGAGNFANPQFIGDYINDSPLVAPLIIDWNEDGRSSLFIAYPFIGLVTCLEYEKGGFGVEEIIVEENSGVLSMKGGDVNADTHMDLILHTNDDLRVYYGDGNGGYDFEPDILIDDLSIRSFELADMDNNGSDDIAVFVPEEGANVEGSLYVIYTTTEGELTEPILLTTCNIPGETKNYKKNFVLADLENDNDFDFVFYHRDFVFLGWQENLLLTMTSEESPSINDLTAYPNPFQDQISLQGELWESNKLASLYLWNASGQLVSIISVDAHQQPQLPTDLPLGSYYLDGRDRTGQQLKVITIIKQ